MHIKWLEWLEVLKNEVLALHHHRNLWKAMTDALELESEAETFRAHYTRCYADAAASAIRRLADGSTDRNSISLRRVIADIRANPSVMTRDRYVSLFDEPGVIDPIRKRAPKEFDEHWGDSGGRIRPDLLDALDKTVAADTKRVAGWVDRTVAHIDKRGVSDPPTFADLDAAIDSVGNVLRKLLLLLTAENWIAMTPTPQDDWRAPFRKPLFG